MPIKGDVLSLQPYSVMFESKKVEKQNVVL